MNSKNILAILELINKGIEIGGDLVPIALKAYSALRAESGLSDDELLAVAESGNIATEKKLKDFIARLDTVSEPNNTEDPGKSS